MTSWLRQSVLDEVTVVILSSKASADFWSLAELFVWFDSEGRDSRKQNATTFMKVLVDLISRDICRKMLSNSQTVEQLAVPFKRYSACHV